MIRSALAAVAIAAFAASPASARTDCGEDYRELWDLMQRHGSYDAC